MTTAHPEGIFSSADRPPGSAAAGAYRRVVIIGWIRKKGMKFHMLGYTEGTGGLHG